MQIQIAENIKRFRTANGYTQGDLAALLSVSAQAVSRWENGQAFPDITLLPLLAKCFKVSIDDLMGQDGLRTQSLEKELNKRKQAIIGDEAQKLQNELCILEIYEELGQTKDFYLCGYFQRLMHLKNDAKLNIEDLDDRISKARKMIGDRIKTTNMSERIFLLNTVATYDQEDGLERWEDECTLPEYIKSNIWDELMLSRYTRENDIEKANIQNQKILYKQIQNVIFYLTEYSLSEKEQRSGADCLQRCKKALDTLSLYSARVDDIFILDRIVAEERYAQALLSSGRAQESLDVFSQITEHLSILYGLSDDCLLYGSVTCLNSFYMTITSNDKLTKCVMNMGGYEKDPRFEQIRDDERFADYIKALKRFYPQNKSRSWVNEKGDLVLDSTWEMLLTRAQIEAQKLSDGNVVVLLTANGSATSVPFQDLSSSIDPEKTVKALLDLKKKDNAKIERLVCLWHDGCIDMPSFAFREALLSVDSANLSTRMLLNGSSGYIVKTVKATMPNGYGS